MACSVYAGFDLWLLSLAFIDVHLKVIPRLIKRLDYFITNFIINKTDFKKKKNSFFTRPFICFFSLRPFFDDSLNLTTW